MIYPDYDRSILSTTSSILAYYGVNNVYPTLPELDAELGTDPRHVALIITDGAGVIPLEGALPADSYMRRHVAATVTSVFPSTTTAATTSYFCGQSAYEHGWLGWQLYFKEYATDANTFMRTTHYTGKPIDGPQPAPTLMPFETVFEKIKKARPDVVTRSQYAFDTYADHGVGERLRIGSFSDLCGNLARISGTDGPSFTISYWGEPDASMHAMGVGSESALRQFRMIDRELSSLSKRVRDMLIIVTADHGLINSTPIYIDDYPDVMDALIMPPMIENRAAALYVKPYRRAEFERLFRERFGEDFLLMSREDVYRTGIFGRGARNRKFDDFIGDYVACAVSDKNLAFRTAGGGDDTLVGKHAGLTEDEMLVPVIIDRT